MKMKTLLPSLALLIAIPRLVSAQTTVFSDNMATSTVNQAPVAPTATSTSYEFLSGLAGGASTISPGALHLELPSTTSVLGEAQARFSSSPVALATAGDFINLTVTFLNTSNIMLAGNNNSSLVLGLYNSGGALPNQGIVQLNAGNTTGGSQNWLGYFGRIIENGTANIVTRPAQTANGTSSQNQDVLFNNASGSQAFNSPQGTQIGSKSTASTPIGLTTGSTYTLDYRITFNSSTSLTISNALYSGSAVNTANTIFNMQSTTAAATTIATAFDSLAIGWRESVASATASSMDISAITVISQIAPIPEPGCLALLAVGATALAFRRKTRI